MIARRAGPLATLLALAACATPTTAPSDGASKGDPTASSPAAEQPAPPQGNAQRTSSGIEVIQWEVPDRPEAIAALLGPMPIPREMDPAAATRLDADGFTVRRVEAIELDTVISALGGSFSDVRTWHGQVPTWRELAQAGIATPTPIDAGGARTWLDPGLLRLLIRGWTVPTEDSGAVDVEIVAAHMARSAGAAVTPPERAGLRGEPLSSTSAAFSMLRGDAVILTAASDASPTAPGALLLIRPGQAGQPEGRRHIILLLAAVPESMDARLGSAP